MAHYSETLTVPYTAGQMFDLAADVERYPQFLEGWRAVRVVRAEGGVRTVDQVLGLGPLRWRFCSEARGARPHWLEIQSNARPFRHLQITWRFCDLATGGSQVDFAARAELRLASLSSLAAEFLTASFDRTVSAFESRAHALYATD